MTSVGKALEGQRKQAGSPMDASQRKPSVPNAWAKGSTNPVTQRPAGTATVNGVTNNQNNKAAPAQKGLSASTKESNTPDRHANDRLSFLFANMMGLSTTITLRNGEKYTGIFSAVITDQSEKRYLLKMVKKAAGHSEKQVNGADSFDGYVGLGDSHAMTFGIPDVADLKVDNVRLDKNLSKHGQNGSSNFKTDADISSGFAGRERDLQPWEGSLETSVDLSLDSNGKGWDQFETNERLYGLKTNYDESFYTTTIDKSHPDYKKRAAEADRIAREIEGTSTMNAHVAEERGQKVADSGLDEESKYSGVRRDYPTIPAGQPNKYTPPARRPPSGQPTVPGAPVDPAIISASLAKPDQKSQSSSKPIAALKENSNAPATLNSEKTDNPKIPAPISTSKPAEKSTSAITPSKLSPSKVAPLTSPGRGSSREGGATATVEKDVVNAFKSFSAIEKMRAQEHQRTMAKRDKAVKLNDLKKFAQNFKLHTPVPNDLIPILAKDKGKQTQIVQKALQTVEGIKATPPKPAASATTTPSEQKPPKTAATRPENTNPPPAGPGERQNQQRQRQNQPNFPQPVRGGAGNHGQPLPANPQRQGPGHLSQRLNMGQQYHRQGQLPNMQQALPPLDPRIPPTGPSSNSSGVQSPTSASLRYTGKTFEFRPAAAAQFQPSSNDSTGSSPVREPTTKAESRQPKRSFFEGRRPIMSESERVSFEDAFNPITRMLAEAKADGKEKDYAINGGIPQAYRTGPTWDVPEANKDKTYLDMYEKSPPNAPSVSSQHNVMTQPPMPHQHQLPMHLQGNQMQPGHTPQHTPRHIPVQPHVGGNGPPHFDDHRMQFSASTSSVHPSPRQIQPFVAYNGQGQQPVQMYQQPMPPYGMSPGGHPMTMRQASSGPHFMAPQGPSMSGHGMGGQPSGGQYMHMNQGPMFSPVPVQAYPHNNGPMQQQIGPGGFPSPRPHAQMMSHGGSQQGHHPQMVYMQPGQHGLVYAQAPTGPMGSMRGGPYNGPHQQQYGTSPHQQHHFPQHQHRGTPSASYAQPMMPNHSMPPQGMQPNGGGPIAVDGPEDGK